MENYRIAKDTLGEVKVPRDAYYGAQTQRAVENFPISGQRLPKAFIRAQAIIKRSAAVANRDTGELEEKKANAIIEAAEEVMNGKLDDQFVVDAYQAGAGTSQNMNANEVIASRASELLGGERGDWTKVHPNDDVNMAQSTNDTIHVAINIAVAEQLNRQFYPSIERTIEALEKKADEFQPYIKSGRTHLQDAVPMRLGQSFEGYAQSLRNAYDAVKMAEPFLYEIGLGGNAVGTGINSHPEYSDRAIQAVAETTGLAFQQPKSRFSFMQNTGAAIRVSHALKEVAIHLIKVSSDFRLLSSGPRTGIAELTLPAVQPGSSIMPGKVNPVIPENLYMICSQVIGNDTAVSTAGIGSQLEINPMMPIIGYNVLQSITILSTGMETFTKRCINGIEPNEGRMSELMEKSLALATALNPKIGYEKAADVAKESFKTGKTVREIILDRGILSEEEADVLLKPENLV
ncbi:class II fumarate hydratase [Pseudalkalibacillus berkeleyi]|uniref:Class II fumarate hydratase n=1 Tax=Pseudalkalibacillus berkeleyi TaxID=1069813 RepID=A0ABS9H3L8_9BACL|nr:class II fumarate hydratase [Pseudalkalibacillus berkeleyi]MCF6138509.1 class II fumarate hydratase [Pseudalkalibacillus berkeleyi]